MIKTVGLAIAFSPTAERMLAEAVAIARFFSARLVLIHVGDHTAKEEQVVKALLEGSGLSSSAISIRWEKGDAARAILHACSSENVDLLIAGALKKENILEYYLGSVARRIMRKASSSVLLLTHPSLHPSGFRNVVVGAEDNPLVTKTVSLACKLAGANNGWVHVVRELKMYGLVMAASDQRTQEEYEDLRQDLVRDEIGKVEVMLQKIPHENVKVNIKVVSGKSGFELGQFARRKQADLLIVSAPRKRFGFFDRVFTHDLEYVFADLPCNLMIVHNGKEARRD